jgi:hypothetical protein
MDNLIFVSPTGYVYSKSPKYNAVGRYQVEFIYMISFNKSGSVM